MSRFNTDGPFRALADNTQDCIMRFDRRACYIYVNPFFTHKCFKSENIINYWAALKKAANFR